MTSPETPPSTRRYRLRGRVEGVERVWPLLPGRSRVGRNADNELVLDEDGVSRHHATLWQESGRLVVTDAKSKNGTFLNGQLAARGEIAPGDVVAFGPVELRCEEAPLEDTLLAIDLGAADQAVAGSRQTRTETALSPREDRDFWLTVGRSFVAALRTTAEPSAALADLATRLRLRGAALLRRGSEPPPVLVATTGTVSAADIDAMVAAWAGDRCDFALAADLCGYAPADPWCLVLAGDFDRRAESSELLALVVESYAAWQAARGAGATASPKRGTAGRSPELRFPAGYVLGSAPAMQAIYEQMRSLVVADQPVLVIGETGVGKEPIARTLHLSSPRRDKPWIPINCAAIPGDLLEAELFGIGERVATGVAGRMGLFRRAAGGTLLLDEVATMALDLQAKLLRVLQEREIFPVGSSAAVAIDARIVAATNAELQTEIDRGSFRRDLYYRLAGYELRIPPLRERRQDIPALVEHFLRRTCAELDGPPVRGLTVGAMQYLSSRPWPGNVRQLEHEIRALVYACPAGGVIDQDLLSRRSIGGRVSADPEARPAATPPAGSPPPASVPAGATLELATLEKAAVKEALRRSQGNQRQAAALLGISRSSLRRRLKRYDIR